ncbi:MAG: response regulator transcription factor [Candidatus Dojkabacteria bacterium]
MKILMIEDEESLRKIVKRYLEKRNFIVDEAEDGREAISKININTYDCLLLDLNLPEIDGITLSKRLKKKGYDIPTIMVTARSQIYNKIEGFEVGADDYITKPFDLSELLARVRAVVKRSSNNKEQILKLENYEIYTERNSLLNMKTGEEITLSNKEMGILEYLLRNKGRIIPTEELMEHVWDGDLDSFSQTVKTHIKTLRHKMDKKKALISTVRGKGYQIK